MALALLAGVVLGGLNGVLTSVLKVPLIIVSLGTLSAYFGLHLDPLRRQGDLRAAEKSSVLSNFRRRPLAAAGVGLDGDCLRHRALFCCMHTRWRDRPCHRLEPCGRRIHRRAYRAYRIYATALVGFLSALSGVMTLAYFKAVDTSSGRRSRPASHCRSRHRRHLARRRLGDDRRSGARRLDHHHDRQRSRLLQRQFRTIRNSSPAS